MVNGSLVASCPVGDKLQEQNRTIAELRAKLEQQAENQRRLIEQKDVEIRQARESERAAKDNLIKEVRETIAQ